MDDCVSIRSHAQRDHASFLWRVLLYALLCLLVGFAFSEEVSAQRLQQIRDVVRGGDSAPAPPPSEEEDDEKDKRKKKDKKRYRPNFFDDDDDYRETLDVEESLPTQVAGLFLQAAALTVGHAVHAVFIGPGSGSELDIEFEMDEDELLAHSQYATDDIIPTVYFPHFPYAEEADGFAMGSDTLVARPVTRSQQLTFRYGSDFETIDWLGVDGVWEFSQSRWGFDGEWLAYREELTTGGDDRLHFGDANVLWRRYQTEQIMFRWGAGLAWMADSDRVDLGINGTCRADLFPLEPIVVSVEYDIASLSGETSQHLQAGIGANWQHVEIFGGVDYRSIASVDIVGPVIGIRGWW